MSGVIRKFFLTSMIMWVLPLSILYGFNHKMFPGTSQLSSSSQTLLSGFIAVISVNVVIGIYIFMAMKEPSGHEHQPDPAFLAQAKASVKQSTSGERNDSQVRDKEE